MRPESIPVVRLEVDYMKHAILHAFTEYSLKVDADVKAAVERFCTPENVMRIVDEAVRTELRAAIEKEIHDFYAYGSGHQYIAGAVKKMLEERHERMKKFGY